MKLTITKTVTVEENLNVKDLKVVRTNSRDIDSTNLEIYYEEKENKIPLWRYIGYGHLNNRTNFVHITLNEDNQDLEDYLVEGIENRTISLS